MLSNYSQQEFDSAKSLDKLSLICLACRSPFLAIKKLITHELKTNKDKLKYCCRKCIGKDMKPLIKTNCSRCDKELIKTSLPKKSKNIFCSSSCAAVFNHAKKFGPNYHTNCITCHKLISIPPQAYNKRKNKTSFYCSKNCRPKKIKVHETYLCEYPKIPTQKQLQWRINIKCPHCNIQFVPKFTASPKHGKRFCSKSCRMKYFNIHHHVHSKVNTSYPENYLFSLLTAEFPYLSIQKNNRTFLQCGLELDILITELKLAIEVNGPVHYRPIFGEERLVKVKEKDQLKAIELQNRQIKLITLDVSQLTKLHEQQKFIESECCKIKELISSLLNQG